MVKLTENEREKIVQFLDSSTCRNHISEHLSYEQASKRQKLSAVKDKVVVTTVPITKKIEPSEVFSFEKSPADIRERLGQLNLRYHHKLGKAIY